ncbi:HD domain-containing phosphohydrolase [Desulfogranum japonicum]|uniref:HD domain-containing phosphohydrolase n=1 Tax=Desulfogranum japonicum TaxID=231447 RepID=UPI0003F963CF|nr:HD domain-containing phosphohydrolase [Desulfogranum japonicum]
MQHDEINILIVDDEPLNRELLRDYLQLLGYGSESVSNGLEALEKLDHNSYDLVFLDIMMPVLDGIETARKIREKHTPTDLPIIMVTALSGREERLQAVEAGANDFIVKPVDKVELTVRTASQLQMKKMQDKVKQYQLHLEELVQERTKSLQKTLEEMRLVRQQTYQAYVDTIQRLGIAAEYKDKNTADHIYRVSEYSKIIAQAIDMPEEDVEILRLASPMHDVGKLGIPDAILMKPGKLTAEEWNIMKQHTLIGKKILEGSKSQLLSAGAVIAASHHEKWDGSGYPLGLEQEDIPIFGRVCAIADVFDALTTVRPYKQAYSPDKAFRLIQNAKGSHFDPKIVNAFVHNFDKILAVMQ